MSFGYHDLERAATAFILEDEHWGAFLQWARENHVSGEFHNWLNAGPDIQELRRQWAAHSPDARIRTLGEHL